MTIEPDSLSSEIPSPLFRDWLAAGKLHLWSNEGGQACICLASLFRCFESGSTPALPNSINPKTGDRK